MKSITIKSVRSPFILRFAVLIFLLVLAGIGAVPGYWTGNWSWATLPQVTNLNEVRELRQTGLELPGWKTVGQKTVVIGGHQWSVQQINKITQNQSVYYCFPKVTTSHNHRSSGWILMDW
jgi:cyanoexosortase B-associated protein